MKSEEFIVECPECGSKDKRISQTKHPKKTKDSLLIPHTPDGACGVIKCDKCGHVFEYCKDRKLPLEVKKKII